MNAPSFLFSIVFWLGLVFIFIGERLIGTGAARAVISLLGVAAVVVSVAARAARSAKAQGERRRVERLALLLKLVGVAGLVLYAMQSDVWTKLAGSSLERGSPIFAGVLSALYPALLVLSILPLLLLEIAYASMQRAPEVESARVRDALLSGVGFACALIFAFTAYYVASERDTKWDFSYFRTAKPGDATRGLVRGLTEKVTLTAFFPPANEVGEQVKEYLDDVARESNQLEVVFHDHALEPTKARELGVTGNGTLVFQRGSQKELMGIGLELERARTQLRNLDEEFQKRLRTVSTQKRTVYLTAGHGEHSADKKDPTDQRFTIKIIRDGLRQLNYDVKPLGVAEGLAVEVPEDAGAVLVLGPTQSFDATELASLERYLDRGGRVLLALDPQGGADFSGFLAKNGLELEKGLIANDQLIWPRTQAPSDRLNIATVAYSSHPSVTTLARLGSQAPSVFVSAVGLKEGGQRPQGGRVDFTVHSHPTTWADLNGNFQLDPPEEGRRIFELAAAVTRPAPQSADGKGETRLLVFGDSEFLGDPVVDKFANAYLLIDGMKWMVGEEAQMGVTNTEEDVPIQHTRKQDMVWFWSTLVVMPALVLGAGFMFTRSRRRGERKGRKDAASAQVREVKS